MPLINDNYPILLEVIIVVHYRKGELKTLSNDVKNQAILTAPLSKNHLFFHPWKL
jgi:hypothetical protein